MKTAITFTLCGTLLMSSCGTYSGEGAFMGSQIGSILGSAIGGINGGPRGADVGTIVGMAGGAAVGAVIGAAADRQQQERYEQAQRQRNSEAPYGGVRNGGYQSPVDDGAQQPTGEYDDRIVFEDETSTGEATLPPGGKSERTISVDDLRRINPQRQQGYHLRELIEVRDISFTESSGDGILNAGEMGQLSFDIINNSHETLVDIAPQVSETTGNKHIVISPNIIVERIAAHQGVRYTAMIKGNKKLKAGDININISLKVGEKVIASQTKDIRVATAAAK